MNIQLIVSELNARLRREYHLDSAPLRLTYTAVEGRALGLRFSSRFTPLRPAGRSGVSVAYKAGVEGDGTDQQPLAAEFLNAYSATDLADAVVLLDRLTRIVHLLSYLPAARSERELILPVHPLHILTVPGRHGLFFEQVLRLCGLDNGRVVFSVALHGGYLRQREALLAGLENYQARGFCISLRLAGPDFGPEDADFLRAAAPAYVELAPALVAAMAEGQWPELTGVIHGVGARVIQDGRLAERSDRPPLLAGVDFYLPEKTWVQGFLRRPDPWGVSPGMPVPAGIGWQGLDDAGGAQP